MRFPKFSQKISPKKWAFFVPLKNPRHDAIFQIPKLHLFAILLLLFQTAFQTKFFRSKSLQTNFSR